MDSQSKEFKIFKRCFKQFVVQLDIYVEMNDLRETGLPEEEVEGYIDFYWEGWYGESKDLGVSLMFGRKDN